MVDPRMILQMAMQRCNDPKMRSIMQDSMNDPQTAIQNLCKNYPDIAKQIDNAIGQGQNPQQLAMNLLNNRTR